MKKVLIRIISFYKSFISPGLELIFGKACRFTPTCSEYTTEAIEKYGAFRGLFLGVKRFLRCHPLGPSGYDPVPEIN